MSLDPWTSSMGNDPWGTSRSNYLLQWVGGGGPVTEISSGGVRTTSGGGNVSGGVSTAPGNLSKEYEKTLKDFLSSPAPTYTAPKAGTAPTYTAPSNAQNRFELGLSGAESRLQNLLNDPSSIEQSAAYKFRLGQGEEALQRQQAARGMLASGNRLMELTKYGQDMASQEYDNQYNRLADLLGTYATNWNTAQATNLQNAANVYGTNMQGYTQRYVADLQNAANVYGTDMQGYNQRGQTLATLLSGLYGSEQTALSQRAQIEAQQQEQAQKQKQQSGGFSANVVYV